MTSSVIAGRLPLPGWLSNTVVCIWLIVVAGTFARDVHRNRLGASTWRSACAAAARNFARREDVLVGRLAVFAAVGYLLLIVVAARRWAPVSVGLIVLPLVLVGVAGYKRLGRGIAGSRRAPHASRGPTGSTTDDTEDVSTNGPGGGQH